MRIALVNTASLFVRGGAEILVDNLMNQLQQRGHIVELFKLPFAIDFGLPLVRLIEASQMLRFDDYDRVIAFKFPAYCVRHRNKSLWMFHQLRQVYELWGKELGLPDEPRYYPIRDIVRHADEALAQTRNTYTIAREVSRRLEKYNGFPSQVLPHICDNVDKCQCIETGDYIFYPSRVNSLKRQLLAISAMRFVRTKVRLIVAGVCEDKAYDMKIREEIKKYKLEKKIQYENRWITNEEKYEWMGKCLASMYIAYQEDSCGLVSMEAFYSSKPVITCTDSGGTLELIEDKKTGFVCEPTPESIAAAMDQLYANKTRAAKMGQDARAEIVSRNITWDNTIRRLLA